MMIKTFAALALAAALAGPVAGAQQRPAPPRTPPAPGAARPAPETQPTPARPAPAVASPAPEVRRRNVNIEVAISDQANTAEPVRKLVAMIVADRQMGSVRSNANVAVRTGPVQSGGVVVMRPVTLNVDAQPVVHADGSVLLSLTVEYRPTAEGAGDGESAAEVNERLSVTLESGKPLVVSRAVDPSGNRKISVEVTATVMK